MNVFKEMAGAIAGTKAYPGFLRNKKGKVFGYAVLVVTIFFIAANVRGIISASIFMGSLDDVIVDNVPYFEVGNGELYIEEPVYFSEDDMLIIIDSDSDIVPSMTESEWKRNLVDYSSVIICDREGILAKSNGELNVAEWPTEFSFDRADIISFLPAISVIIFVFYFFAYLFGIGGYFFAALFVALVGMIIASVQNYRATFGQIYLLAIYAKTLPLFIKGFCRLTGLSGLPLMGTLIGWGGFALACVYVAMALSRIDKENKSREAQPVIEGGFDAGNY